MAVLELLIREFNLRVFEESIPRIEKSLALMTMDDVWYKPNDSSNSAGHLILHLCGNVTQWIGSGVGGREDLRQRDLEFSTEERLSKDVLIAKLYGLKATTESSLATLTRDEDLLDPRVVQGFNQTVLGIIVHVIEHFSYHTGQIAWIAKYLKDEDLGFYAGIDLNAKT